MIGAVAVLVIGPKEIPVVMNALGRIVRRLQYVRFAISQQFEDFMRTQDLEDLRKQVNFEQKEFDEALQDEIYGFESPKDE